MEAYHKTYKDKRGKRLTTRAVLKIDLESGSTAVPVSSGRTMKAACEDVRATLVEDSFALKVDSIDTGNRKISSVLHNQCTALEPDESFINAQATSNDDDVDDDITLARPNTRNRVEVFWPMDN